MANSGASSGIYGITTDYSRDSKFCAFASCATTLALYNVVEMNLLVFVIFKRYKHLYFWSLLVASWGVVLYALGFFLKFLNLANKPFCIAISGLGWWFMVTGQSVVLYSRLHLLLVENTAVLSRIRWMIIINGIFLHPTTTATAFGSNWDASQAVVDGFVRAYKAMEKIQLTGFCIQELIISSIYLFEAWKFSKSVQRLEARKTVRQLLCVNVALILMDLGLLSIEMANLYAIQILCKGVVYSIKLKLELAVLGQLIRLVQPRLQDLAAIGGGNASNVVNTTFTETETSTTDTISPRQTKVNKTIDQNSAP